jgi:hypothetical protein
MLAHYAYICATFSYIHFHRYPKFVGYFVGDLDGIHSLVLSYPVPVKASGKSTLACCGILCPTYVYLDIVEVVGSNPISPIGYLLTV